MDLPIRDSPNFQTTKNVYCRGHYTTLAHACCCRHERTINFSCRKEIIMQFILSIKFSWEQEVRPELFFAAGSYSVQIKRIRAINYLLCDENIMSRSTTAKKIVNHLATLLKYTYTYFSTGRYTCRLYNIISLEYHTQTPMESFN